MFVDFAADEVALLVEMVVDLGVDWLNFCRVFILRNRIIARYRRRKGRCEFSALLLSERPVS